MNDAMSFGIHRLWKKFTINIARVRAGHQVLDLASGTGDLALAFSDLVGETGTVIMTDINASMLGQGRARVIDAGRSNNIRFAQLSAESLPFPDTCFDRVSIAFGLRNVTDKIAALREMNRVLRPGGMALVLEFSKPVVPGLAPVYDFYSFQVIPRMGKLLAGDESSYRYLAESIRMHPDQKTLSAMMEDAGFDQVQVNNLSGGIVALHRGLKF